MPCKSTVITRGTLYRCAQICCGCSRQPTCLNVQGPRFQEALPSSAEQKQLLDHNSKLYRSLVLPYLQYCESWCRIREGGCRIRGEQRFKILNIRTAQVSAQFRRWDYSRISVIVTRKQSINRIFEPSGTKKVVELMQPPSLTLNDKAKSLLFL